MLFHMDNFTIYGGNKALMLNGVYAAVPNDGGFVNDPDGSPGQVMRFFYNSVLRFVLPTLMSTVGVAERLYFYALPDGSTNGQNHPMRLYDIGLTTLVDLNVDNTGRIRVNGVSTPNPVVTANGWYHIEMKAKQGGAGASEVEVRVEGVTVLQLTGLTFANNNQFASFGIVNDFGPQTHFWAIKDLVLWNNTGAYNTDFIGACIVANLKPVSDVQVGWTPSTGTQGWPILDNQPPNDGIYLSAGTSLPPPYIGELSDLPPDVTSVRALQTYVRAAKTDGGDGGLQVSLISSGIEGDGLNRPITVAQTYWRDVFETDPATNAPWLPSAVNAARIQLDRTA